MAKTELSEKESLLVRQVVEAVQRGARLDDSIKRTLRGITTDGGRYSYLYRLIEGEAKKQLRHASRAKKQGRVKTDLRPVITPLMKLEGEIRDRDTPPSSR